MTGRHWEPRIVAFCCHHCAYGAADMAGILRLQYPDNLRIIRVLCSGRIDEELVLHAFISGADGVMVAGCLEGSCHYMTGNTRAAKRVDRLRTLLAQTGLEPERLGMYLLSAAMGATFAQMATGFVERLHRLGPVSAGAGVEREGEFYS